MHFCIFFWSSTEASLVSIISACKIFQIQNPSTINIWPLNLLFRRPSLSKYDMTLQTAHNKISHTSLNHQVIVVGPNGSHHREMRQWPLRAWEALGAKARICSEARAWLLPISTSLSLHRYSMLSEALGPHGEFGKNNSDWGIFCGFSHLWNTRMIRI